MFKFVVLLVFIISFSNSVFVDLDFGYSEKCAYMAERYAVQTFEKEIGEKVQSLGDFLNISTSSVYAGPGKEPNEFSVRITNLLDGGTSAIELGYTTVPDVNVYYKVIFALDFSTATNFPIDVCKLVSVEKYESK